MNEVEKTVEERIESNHLPAIEQTHLPATVNELQKFILVGRATLKLYQEELKLIDDLGFSKKVRDQALEDGQSVGEAILWAEAKLGELLKKVSPGKETAIPGGNRKKLPEGITGKQSYKARLLADNQEIIEEVIKEAKAEEDLPTRSAVLSKIKEKNREPSEPKPVPEPPKNVMPKLTVSEKKEESAYQTGLLEALGRIPPEPPKHISQEGLDIIRDYWQRIIQRGNKFNKTFSEKFEPPMKHLIGVLRLFQEDGRVQFDGDWVRIFGEDLRVAYPWSTGVTCAVWADRLYKGLEKMRGNVKLSLLPEGWLGLTDTSTKLTLRPDKVSEKELSEFKADLEAAEWFPVPKGFSEGLSYCLNPEIQDNSREEMSGVAFMGKNIVSADNYRASHYQMESGITDELFRLEFNSVESLVKLKEDFERVAVNNMWLNLKARDGMVISVRILPPAEYPIDKVLGAFEQFDGIETQEFPEDLKNAIERVELMADESDLADYTTEITIRKDGDYLVLSGGKESGQAETKILWDDDLPVPIVVSPSFLKRILAITRKFKILHTPWTSTEDQRSILFEIPNFRYLIVTGKPKEKASSIV